MRTIFGAAVIIASLVLLAWNERCAMLLGGPPGIAAAAAPTSLSLRAYLALAVPFLQINPTCGILSGIDEPRYSRCRRERQAAARELQTAAMILSWLLRAGVFVGVLVGLILVPGKLKTLRRAGALLGSFGRR